MLNPSPVSHAPERIKNDTEWWGKAVLPNEKRASITPRDVLAHNTIHFFSCSTIAVYFLFILSSMAQISLCMVRSHLLSMKMPFQG